MFLSKKIVVFLSMILLIPMSFATSKIDKNKDRITEINRQLNTNKKKIQKNTSKITDAKKNEAKIKREITKLNDKIYSLQKEYNALERKYILLEKNISRNEYEIRNSVRKIESSNDAIDRKEEEYAGRIKALDQIRRSKLIKKSSNYEGVVDTKRKQDIKKLLDLQAVNINSIKYYKKTIEENKSNVEHIKDRNLNEVRNIKRSRLDLEKKRKELRIAKNEKDRKVEELKRIQKHLGLQNKKIASSTSQLIREKQKLESQIKNIIAQENKRRQELEKQKTLKIIKGTGQLAMPIKGHVVVAFKQEKVAGLKSNGIEIRGVLGQSVHSADNGTVIHAGNFGSLGGIVIIDHNNMVTVYGNLSTIRVKKGQNVRKGETIGTLGRDSATKETNLYFETRKGVNLVDPLKYL